MTLLAIGGFGAFALFLLLGLGALPFTAALDQKIGKEKALLIYAGLLLLFTFAVFGAQSPSKRVPQPSGVKNLTVDDLDMQGDPFSRPAYALVQTGDERGEAAPRNFFQRYSDTSDLAPPVLDAPPWLALDIALPPTVPGPAPGSRWVLRGPKPSIDVDATSGIADVPDRVFEDYPVSPEDVYDSITRGGTTTFIYIIMLDGIRNGEPGYDELARRLVSEEESDVVVRFGMAGGPKQAANKLDPVSVNNVRQTPSGSGRTPEKGEVWRLRRTVRNLYEESLLRNGLPLTLREGNPNVGALRRAAREMAEVGRTGKEGGLGWQRAAELLEHALTEATRVGNPQTRTDVLLELLAAYRALHDEKSELRVLADYVRTNPRRPDGWTWLGDLVQDRMGQASLALDYYDKALEFNRSFGDALVGQGRALSLAGEFERASSVFGRTPSANRGKYYSALGKLRTGRLESAKSELDALLVQQPDAADVILLRGCVLYAIGEDLGSARQSFERVATMDGAAAHRAKACYNLGLTCVRMGQKDAARKAFDLATRALRLGASPGDTPDEMISPSLGLAFLAWAEGSSHNEVTKYLDAARMGAPRSSYVEMFAGMHAASEQNYTKAESALTKAMRYAPNYAELDGWLGRVYLGLARAAVESGADPKDSAQDFERAIRFTERAADREEKSIKGAYAMRVREAMVRAAAEHLGRRTRYSDARTTVQRVLTRDKNREQPAALALRGYCNFQLEDYPQCMRDFQQVLDVVPADAEDNPWRAYREYGAARLEDVKRWRSLERKNVVFEGVSLNKDWSDEQSGGVKIRIDEGVLEATGESNKDGTLTKPVFSAMNQTLFDKATFVEISLTAAIPSEVNGKFLNNNVSGIRVAQASRSGRRGGSRKSSSIGIFSDKGRIAVQVGNGREEKFKDGLVHRLLDDNGKEITWPSNGPVRIRIVREDDEKGVLAIYLNGEFVFRETISGFKTSRGPLGLSIMGYGNQAQPFNVRVNDIEVIRRKSDQ